MNVAARRTVVPEPDVRGIRRRLGVSQSEFALMLGISARTLQNWEQLRRQPTGPARVLLLLAQKRPDLFTEMMSHVG
jgi:putative transcriptional regulator